MKTHLRSIRFGLLRSLIFGALVTTLLLAGELWVLKRFERYVNAIYLTNTLPVAELSDVRASFLDVRRRLWKALAQRNRADDSTIVAGVQADLATMDAAWAAYYPAGVSSNRERIASQALLEELPRLRELAATAAALTAAGQYDAASTYLHARFGYMVQVDRLIKEGIDANVMQASGLAAHSTRMMERSLQAAAVLIGLGLAALSGMALRLLRERDDARKNSRYSFWLIDQAFELTQDGMMITDAGGKIEKVNPAFVNLTGYSEAELIGNTPRLFSSGRQSPEFYREMWGVLRESGQWRGELWNRRKDGAIYRESLSISGIRGPNGKVSNFVAVCADITQRQQAQDRLGYLATHDQLTGLPNRTLLAERLTQAIARARRAGTQVAVMFVDLDGFKTINDTLGHGIGDETLIAVADRLKGSLRDADTVARLGGDEFAIVLEDIGDIDCVAPLADKLVRAVSDVQEIQGHRIDVTPSIGISLYPRDATAPDTLLALADQSMYVAKRGGKNGYVFNASVPNSTA